MSKDFLVIGKNGQLGRSLQKIVKSCLNSLSGKTNEPEPIQELMLIGVSFIFVARDELDLSNTQSIKKFFQNKKLAGIINCAAFTSVDNAESDLKLVEQINHHAVDQLAKFAKDLNIPLIHISTDYVFNGQVSKPYLETDKTDPLNIYGSTKLKAEQAIIESGCNGAIIRTSWLYSEFGNNFVKRMIALGNKHENVRVINDQVGSPTYALNLAKLIFLMINKNKITKILNSYINTYHFSDDGICSRYDFTKAIFEINGINCKLEPVKSKDYHSNAIRPNYSVLNKDKIKNHFPELVIPHWQESLIDCMSELKNIES